MISSPYDLVQAALAEVPDLQDLLIIDCIRKRAEHVVFSAVWHEQQVLLKLFKGDNGPRLAQAAFDESTDRAVLMNNGDLRVAAPLYLASPQGLYLSEWIEGDRLDDLFKQIEPDAGLPIYHRAGAWFQRYTNDRQRHRDFNPKRWMERALARPNDPRISALCDRLSRHANHLSGEQIRQARIHGDFIPANLILSGETLTGIDINNANYMALVKDIARFLAQAEAYWDEDANPNQTGLPEHRTSHFLQGFGTLEQTEADHLLPFFYGWELTQRYDPETADTPDQRNYRRTIDAYLSVG